MPNPLKLLVIEPDGVLNQVPEGYIRSADAWVPLPGAMEAVARLNHAGWRVVVLSVQSGLGRGLIDMDTLNAVHVRMHKALNEEGARVEAVFFCPHRHEEACECKDPHSGLLAQIAQRMAVPLNQLVGVCSTPAYAETAHARGCLAHCVLSGNHPADQVQALSAGIRVHADLAAFADFWLSPENKTAD